MTDRHYSAYALQGLFFLFLLALAGCGFQPRSFTPLAKPLHNVYIQAHDPYSELTRNIKQYLRMSGVHLVANPQEASTILSIDREISGQELLSINSSQQTRQYNLRLAVAFEISDNRGQIITGPQTLTETRPLTLQSNQILAGSNQAAQLYHDMRRSITYSLMNWLSSKAVTQELQHHATQAKP